MPLQWVSLTNKCNYNKSLMNKHIWLQISYEQAPSHECLISKRLWNECLINKCLYNKSITNKSIWQWLSYKPVPSHKCLIRKRLCNEYLTKKRLQQWESYEQAPLTMRVLQTSASNNDYKIGVTWFSWQFIILLKKKVHLWSASAPIVSYKQVPLQQESYKQAPLTTSDYNPAPSHECLIIKRLCNKCLMMKRLYSESLTNKSLWQQESYEQAPPKTSVL